MIAIAWAIVFASVCFSDAIYTLKFGKEHEDSYSAKSLGRIAMISLFLCIIFSMLSLAK